MGGGNLLVSINFVVASHELLSPGGCICIFFCSLADDFVLLLNLFIT